MNSEMMNEIRRSLGWLTALGVLMVLLGIAAIAEPVIATILVARVLSWIFCSLGLCARSMPGNLADSKVSGSCC
ncbi:MAG: hypothetical protein K6T90_20425 [Leptolyngbyaceae cyanobacterium HOT.MB2.61]|nr:hypothetical protein [Leptolyngbyaceae cyanobacterium HOT.MB2.61]